MNRDSAKPRKRHRRAMDRKAAPGEPVASDAPHSGRLRVLVLDDEAPIRRMARAALESTDCEVETAENGRIGLQILLNEIFEVVVVDIRMMEMDGLAFIQEALKIWPWLGVVIITGYPDPETIDRAHELGVSRILEKPFEVATLQREVQEEYQEKKQSSASMPPQSFDQIQSQLSILRQMSDSVLTGHGLLEALGKISHGLSRYLPCDAFGVLGLEEDERALMLTLQRKVPQTFVDTIEQEMLKRYQALSGHTLSLETLRIEIDGPPPQEGESYEVNQGSIFTVPVIAEGNVHGLLTMASVQPGAYGPADISFLYHAANQFSTVLGAMRHMHNMAVHDPLTGVYNRRQLMIELTQAWELSRRHEQPLSIVVIDIDHFKQLNDEHGHLIGDRILREFAQLLSSICRASDVIGRFGGDEFVVLLPQTRASEARSFGERFLQASRSTTFLADSLQLHMLPSIGVATNESMPLPDTPEHLLEQADRALYASKNTGRARVSVWSTQLSTPDNEHTAPPPPESNTLPDTCLGRVLIVDDETSVCRLIKRMLEKSMYEAETETTAYRALDRIRSHPNHFDAVLIDLQLSEESGLDFLEQLQGLDADLVKIVITGHATVDNAIASLRQGAYDFIEKPVVHEQLIAVLNRAVQYRRLTRENLRYQLYLEDMVHQKSAALSQALDDTREAYNFTLEAMVRLLDAREQTTGQHSIRVRDLSLILGRSMQLGQEELDMLNQGAILHDIGKIGIPDSILLKAGPLDEHEWDVMRSHPQIGFDILKSIPYLEGAADIVHSHHEHFDGSGYPRRLSGCEICLGARIFAVVDAYDAMRSTRVYRGAMPVEEVVEEIRRCNGSQFDPAVVSAMEDCIDAFEELGHWGT